ncbi:MAG: acyl-CoA carboxylase subunit epsilon [Micromonosporaceae bacterium]
MTDEARPLLRVVRGAPTDEELAALTVVVTARTAAAPEPARAPRSEWRNRAALLRPPLHSGPDAWRNSARPH